MSTNTHSIPVLVNGANGRMGREAVRAIENDPALQLVGQAGRGDNLSELIKSTGAEVVVDLTLASCAFENVLTIIEAGARPVVGTSGLLPEQIDKLSQRIRDKNLGGVIAPNFSMGAVLMMKYAADAAKYLNNVEIIELHHDGKEDSPSGTAMKTSEMMAENFSSVPVNKPSREMLPGSRGATNHNIPIHAVRLPGFVASQEVIFGGVGESLRIKHDSINRECFMPGILLACKKVVELDELVYGLEKLL